MMKPFAYDLTFPGWKEWMKENQQPAFRAKQVMDWLYVKRVDAFDQMTNLPKDLRERLNETFRLQPLDVLTTQVSSDGTVKFLFGLHDKHAIETVIMRHQYGISVCVTTQVGCRVGCTFCAQAKSWPRWYRPRSIWIKRMNV
jgi:23S rRNA (adenine2503-C2)-methyltransferase